MTSSEHHHNVCYKSITNFRINIRNTRTTNLLLSWLYKLNWTNSNQTWYSGTGHSQHAKHELGYITLTWQPGLELTLGLGILESCCWIARRSSSSSWFSSEQGDIALHVMLFVWWGTSPFIPGKKNNGHRPPDKRGEFKINFLISQTNCMAKFMRFWYL